MLLSETLPDILQAATDALQLLGSERQAWALAAAGSVRQLARVSELLGGGELREALALVCNEDARAEACAPVNTATPRIPSTSHHRGSTLPRYLQVLVFTGSFVVVVFAGAC